MLNPNNLETSPYRLRSFVRRDSRLTPAQARALETSWSRLGLRINHGEYDFTQLFASSAPTFLEIGFGMGHSLLAVAKANPDKHFIGIETHLPGIGALLLGIEKANLSNLRVAYGDVVDVLQKVIPKQSLAGIHIFFPDPWQKRRHHARRLIQPDFLQLCHPLLQSQGELHLATDWEDYALHMMRVLSADRQWKNKMGNQQFATRSPYRPVVTKFENRALSAGRCIFELQFEMLWEVVC